MNISPITNQNQNPTFNAGIISNGYWSKFKAYLQYNKGRKGYHDTSNELRLIKGIEKAIEEHPSDALLKFSAENDKAGPFCFGIIESEYGRIYDVERARDDSITAQIENLLRKLLNYENKDLFNRLMGTGYENKYDAWWNKHIRPIWSDIVEIFREETCEESFDHTKWDIKMNKQFMDRNSEKKEPESTTYIPWWKKFFTRIV